MFIAIIRKIRKLLLSFNAWVEPKSDPTELNVKTSIDLNICATAIQLLNRMHNWKKNLQVLPELRKGEQDPRV